MAQKGTANNRHKNSIRLPNLKQVQNSEIEYSDNNTN